MIVYTTLFCISLCFTAGVSPRQLFLLYYALSLKLPICLRVCVSGATWQRQKSCRYNRRSFWWQEILHWHRSGDTASRLAGDRPGLDFWLATQRRNWQNHKSEWSLLPAAMRRPESTPHRCLCRYMRDILVTNTKTGRSSGDEIAKENFLYDYIVRVLQYQ